MTEPTAPAELRIVSGSPTEDELAALAAVLVAVGSSAPPTPAAPPVRGRWNDPAHAVRRTWAVGPGGWRAAR